MEETHAALVCQWAYEPPYHIYNFPAWADMKKDEIEFGDPVLRKEQYWVAVDEADELIGYAQLFPMGGVTRLGLGLRPDLRGMGRGSRLAQSAAALALSLKPGNEVDLEVLTWNKRAVRAYAKAGFIITDTYYRPLLHGDVGECHCMVFNPDYRGYPQTE
ncbi:GNAT family N-acetyltransferase [Paenibacillus sp. CAU 1782]